MKFSYWYISSLIIVGGFALSPFAPAQEEVPKSAVEAAKRAVKLVCPLCEKAADSQCSAEYEHKIYTFCSADCIEKFKIARKESLYDKIGGKGSVSAAIDLFYKKLLADERVSHFFEDVSMKRQHSKQKMYIAAALGGPEPWVGKDLRKAHSSLDLTETDFGIVAGHLQSTLEELKIDNELVGQIMKIVGSTKEAVLGKAKPQAKP